jgi:hypothetical protein
MVEVKFIGRVSSAHCQRLTKNICKRLAGAKSIGSKVSRLPTKNVMTEPINISFRIADTNQEFEAGASLFQQYAGFIGIDLSFQNFAEELNTIDKQYMKPQGSLIIAYNGIKAVVALH